MDVKTTGAAPTYTARPSRNVPDVMNVRYCNFIDELLHRRYHTIRPFDQREMGMSEDKADEIEHDESGDIERPVRRYALLIGAIGVLFSICVLLHFFLVEQPRMEAAMEVEEQVEEQVDDVE